MKIDIIIDKLTPCLIEISTDNVLQTVFSIATEDELSGLKEKGWLFDWTDEVLHKTNIYKLMTKGDTEIQGLISAEVVRGAVYVHLAESAPHNLPPDKKYAGVGGHLFAIAMKLSLANGFGGYIFMDAKNQKLVEHYIETLGARRVSTRYHEHRLEVSEENAQKIIEKYTLEGDLDVR
ncbi:MAG: hypothetical protein FWD05_07740 [Oscillospiraceae bacterium]|nr:hypothetical protein [Oscillospiraceae bacterium]